METSTLDTVTGVMYRRVITTVVFGDGSAKSTAQDYAFAKASDRWVVAGAPFDYRGPGVAPAGPAGRSCGGRGDEAVGKGCSMFFPMFFPIYSFVSSTFSFFFFIFNFVLLC